MTEDAVLYAYFGHHKCASSWIHRILSNVAWSAGLELAYLDGPSQFGHDLNGHVGRNAIDLLAYANADWRHVETLGAFRGFHVIRDPRDIIISGYFSHLHSHATDAWPELEAHRAAVKELPQKDGILREIEFSAPSLERLGTWNYDHPDILELRQESFTKRPYEGFLDVFSFLGLLDESDTAAWSRLRGSVLGSWNGLSRRAAVLRLPRSRMRKIPAERILGAVYENRYSKLAGGRQIGTEDVRSHYRKGTAGDWRNYFDDEIVAAFKARFNDLLIGLRYELDPDWGVEPSREQQA